MFINLFFEIKTGTCFDAKRSMGTLRAGEGEQVTGERIYNVEC